MASTHKRRADDVIEMKLPRRKFLHLAAGAAALPAMSRVARAQAYPMRPVRIIVGLLPAAETTFGHCPTIAAVVERSSPICGGNVTTSGFSRPVWLRVKKATQCPN